MLIKVKFLEDYSGVETDNVAYRAGMTADVEYVWFERLIQDKRAVVVNAQTKRRKATSGEVRNVNEK